jgi:tRNA threonylcarbamoyladenosine biosynthesis protein TsaE
VKFTLCTIDQNFEPLAKHISEQVVDGKNIVLLVGELGAGKTTLVKHYLNYLGEDLDSVDSPTFSLVNTYELPHTQVHHFDLYRLQSPEEIEDIGFMEYVDSGNICFVEWPEKIADFLPQDRVLEIEITVSLEQCREYSVS